jgi:UDP-N-acetylmuramate dehydrogenase
MTVESARARLKEDLTGEVRSFEPMSRHTTFRIGGPAALFCVLDTTHDVSVAMRVLEEEGVAWTVIGKGSDLLVADAGYEGAVLLLGREFKRHVIEGETLRAGAASILAHLVQDAFSRGLSGLEWAVGIPGTLGGALAMNAGTRDGAIGKVVDTVTMYVPGQGLMLVHGRDVVWDYRRSGLAGRGIILETALDVSEGEPARIRAQMERNLRDRKVSQPLGLPSAGSVFVNPPGDSAGRLIESAGLKGLQMGGARVSTVHANFIVNEGGATAADVIGLIRRISMTVKDVCGVDLRPEIKFVGAFEEA